MFYLGFNVIYLLVDKWFVEKLFIESSSNSTITLSKLIAREQSGFALNYIF